MNDNLLHNVRFGADGLVPVVVQDVDSGDVLMLAFMNDDALRQTVATKRAHYWSRSRAKLWRKGETSGNEQVVDEILINCEQNSLLLRVHQRGAVCHDGFETCFYRTVDDDGSFTTVRERAFDPSQVYANASAPGAAERALADATQRQYGAYVFLRENDFEAVSGTSRRLRHDEFDISSRVSDELRELAGVLNGTHQHGDLKSDVLLEACQVIYWLLLAAVRDGIAWSALRPDRALHTADPAFDPGTVARLLSRAAEGWIDPELECSDPTPHVHATLALVAQAGRAAGVHPLDVVLSDLADLESRPYMQPYFSSPAT